MSKLVKKVGEKLGNTFQIVEKAMLKKALKKIIPDLVADMEAFGCDWAKVKQEENEIVYGTLSDGQIKHKRTEDELSKIQDHIPKMFDGFVTEEHVRSVFKSLFVQIEGDDISIKINSPHFGVIPINYKKSKVCPKPKP